LEKIIKRLRLESDSFQDSFDKLSRAKNLEELAKNFSQILGYNLLVKNLVVFFKYKEKAEWQLLFSAHKSDSDYHLLLNTNSEFGVLEINHPMFKISINQLLFNKATFKILLGKKHDGSAYNEFDKIFLRFFLQQLASAYQFYMARKKEKELIFALNHRVLQLNSLIDTGIEISRLQETNHLLRLSLERVLALTNASKGMLRIREGRQVLERIFLPFPFKSKKLEQGQHVISASFRFSNKIFRFFLFEKESRTGLVDFDDTDQLLLDAFARQVQVSLENNYLYEQSLEKERIDREISIAGAIQKNLIPEELPIIKGYDQFGINIPTKFIGGDYYDCIPLKDGRYVFIMADVSGKGIAASLLVSTLHASANAYLNGPFELESLVQKLNEVVYEAATIDKFITAVFSVLNPEKDELLTVNAGHNPTYILHKDKDVEEIISSGIPLGMMRESFPYKSVKSVLKPGDRVFFYTDGVTEAMNERDEQYDDIRPIKDFLISNKTSTAKDFITELMADMNDFTGETSQSDDITALYLVKKDF
jgi:sigma-B regulation protein RsbU (phosphoserine phosphatase)